MVALSSPSPSPAPLRGDSESASSTRSQSSGDLDFDKPDKAALKHISQSRLEVDESVVRAEGEDRTTAFVWWLVIAAATGGLLFGYDVRMRHASRLQRDADGWNACRPASLAVLLSTRMSTPTSVATRSAAQTRRWVPLVSCCLRGP